MLIIAVTGGLGSGKSRVAHLFKQKNIPVISADAVAKTLTQPNQPAYQSICDHFGPAILKVDGQLARRRLREIIFSDEEQRQWLESLLHPLIKTAIHEQVNQLDSIYPYCLLEIPLLAEIGRDPWIDRVLVVDTSKKNRMERVTQRDQVDHSLIKKMMASQVNRIKRLSLADDIIDNNGDITRLSHQVDDLHSYYVTLSNEELSSSS